MFRSTHTSGFTATQNKAWLRDNYRQLRHKYDEIVQEANVRMEQVKQRQNELKLQEQQRRSK